MQMESVSTIVSTIDWILTYEDTQVEFPHLQYLTLHEVSFTFSHSLYTLLSSCGDSLLTFEMICMPSITTNPTLIFLSACIGFMDNELDMLARQRGLQLLSLKQRCTLTDHLIKKGQYVLNNFGNLLISFRWGDLRILSIDSVLPDTRIGQIISKADQYMITKHWFFILIYIKAASSGDCKHSLGRTIWARSKHKKPSRSETFTTYVLPLFIHFEN